MSEHVVELLPLYALGGLEPDELARVEAHLPVCADCRSQADELLEVSHMLAASVPARAPSARVRAAVLGRVGRARPARPVPVPAVRAAPRPGGRRWGASGWALAGLITVVVGLLGWNVYLTQQVNSLTGQVADLGRQYRAQAAAVALISSPSTESMHLAGQGNHVTASGRAYVDPDSHNVVLVVEKLEPLDTSQTYQAWVITPEGGTKNAGLVTVSRSGWGMAWLSVPYAEGGKVGVSVEPAGGSPQPSQVVLLSGS